MNNDTFIYYFITGTGRCGTKLYAKIFDQSIHSKCYHEKLFRHHSMVSVYKDKSIQAFKEDILALVKHAKQECQGLYSLGISSGHLYFAIPLLYKILGDRVRFILSVRQPEEFIRSALARGFFDHSHPNYCEQLPFNSYESLRSGNHASVTPFELVAWYWRLVNEYTLRTFMDIPQYLWKVVPLEVLTPEKMLELALWLNIEDLSLEKISSLLMQRVNVSPQHAQQKTHLQEEYIDVNQYSIPIQYGTLSTKQKYIVDYYTKDMAESIYRERFYINSPLLPITELLYKSVSKETEKIS